MAWVAVSILLKTLPDSKGSCKCWEVRIEFCLRIQKSEEWSYSSNVIFFFFFLFCRHKTDLKFLWVQSSTEWKQYHGTRKYNTTVLVHSVSILFWLVLQCSFIASNTRPSFYTEVVWQDTSLMYCFYFLTGHILETRTSSETLALTVPVFLPR